MREKIREYLELAHDYPLSDHISAIALPPTGYELREDVCHSAVRGKIQFAVRDDDLDYTTLNLKVVEENGARFTTDDACEEWLMSLPHELTYTAESCLQKLGQRS